MAYIGRFYSIDVSVQEPQRFSNSENVLFPALCWFVFTFPNVMSMTCFHRRYIIKGLGSALVAALKLTDSELCKPLPQHFYFQYNSFVIDLELLSVANLVPVPHHK